ncbi:MAG: RluA family pseudouridine synthase [Candidatus Binatia bacterium]
MKPPIEKPPPPTDIAPASRRLVHTVNGVAGVARLVDYMKDRLALVPVIEVGDLITSGFVTIAVGDNEVSGRTVDLVADGDRLSIDTSALARLEAAGRWNPPWPCELSIVHEDDELVVVEKPACMHVHPLGDSREHTLVNALVHYAGGRSADPWARWRPHAAQRLDAVVSGLLVVAKSAETKAALVRAQMKREIQRIYRALVIGHVDAEGGVIDSPLGREPGRFRRGVVELGDGGRHAVTRWITVERFADRTLVELTPETGRTHQLRAHLASIGHPIVGDHLYSLLAASEEPARLDNATMTPIALHATRLRLRHPRTHEMLELESPLPATFGLA